MTDLGFDDLEGEPERADSRARRWFRIAITLTVVAAMVVLAAIEGSGFIIRGEAPEPTPSIFVPAARIAVVDANGALVTMDRDGGSIAAYATPGVDFQFPAWSPDGSHIAAIGLSADGGSIHVFAARAQGADASEPVVPYRSADRPPFYLYWSPTSQHLTFLTTEPDGLALRVAPADGSAPDLTIRNGSPMYWDWVDPARLLVHSGGGSSGFLGEVGLDGAAIQPVDGVAGLFRAPDVSRDGMTRAHVAGGNGDVGEVVVRSRDGATSQRVRIFGSAAFGFDPNDDALAFVAPDQPSSPAGPLPMGPLRLLDNGSGDVRTLINGSVVAFFWAPDGRSIAALRLGSPDDDGVTEARQDVVPALARGPSNVASAAVTAQGLPIQLVFVDVASGTIGSERTVQVSELLVNQVLPFFDQYALSHRFWSPDSSSIVLPLEGDGSGTRLFVIPADGSEPRSIADGVMGSWSP